MLKQKYEDNFFALDFGPSKLTYVNAEKINLNSIIDDSFRQI